MEPMAKKGPAEQEMSREQAIDRDKVAEEAMEELQAGLVEVHFLLDRLRNVIWQTRLQANGAQLDSRVFRKKFMLLGEDLGEDGMEPEPDGRPRGK